MNRVPRPPFICYLSPWDVGASHSPGSRRAIRGLFPASLWAGSCWEPGAWMCGWEAHLIYGLPSLRLSFSAPEGTDDTHWAGLAGVLWKIKRIWKEGRGHQEKRPGEGLRRPVASGSKTSISPHTGRSVRKLREPLMPRPSGVLAPGDLGGPESRSDPISENQVWFLSSPPPPRPPRPAPMLKGRETYRQTEPSMSLPKSCPLTYSQVPGCVAA